MANTVGANQPFRYRGYVYDEETGFYYLQSRYYDPTTCRFISADVLLSTGQGVLGHNSFAYCNNNPIVMIDSEGTFPILALIALACVVVVACTTTSCSNSTNDFGVDTENRGNCYQYATGLPYAAFDKGLYFPGYTLGYSDYYRFDSPELLKNAIQADYDSAFRNSEYSYTVSICDSTTEPANTDEWVIAYCYSEESFHFLRKDKGVGWHHKWGWGVKPTNLDKDNRVITDLNSANLGDYSKSTLIYLKITKTQRSAY